MHQGGSSVMHNFYRRFRVPHQIGSNSNSGMTLKESSRLLNSDVLRTVTLLKKSKTCKAEFRPFFIDTCHSASANENRALLTNPFTNNLHINVWLQVVIPKNITYKFSESCRSVMANVYI